MRLGRRLRWGSCCRLCVVGGATWLGLGLGLELELGSGEGSGLGYGLGLGLVLGLGGRGVTRRRAKPVFRPLVITSS